MVVWIGPVGADMAPLCCDFFDENNFVQRRKRKIGMQAGLASRNLAIIVYLACPAHHKEYWAVSILVQHGVPDFHKRFARFASGIFKIPVARRFSRSPPVVIN